MSEDDEEDIAQEKERKPIGDIANENNQLDVSLAINAKEMSLEDFTKLLGEEEEEGNGETVRGSLGVDPKEASEKPNQSIKPNEPKKRFFPRY